QALEVAEEIIDAAEMGAVLREMGKSEYPEVREAMARLAAIRPGPGTTRLLTEMMGEPNIVVRRSAALALAELRDRAAVGVLKRNLSSEDQELRLNCAWALARLGEKDGATIALTGLQNPDVLFQKRAVETLGYLGDSGAIGPLLKVMTDSELEVKAAAGWALARLGEPKGIEMLVRLSEQSVEPVRTQANKYLSDSALPWRCRHLIPLVRSQLVREKLGMKEATYRRIKVLPVSGSVVIDGKDSERFWKTIPPENTFILSGPELVPADVQSWISFAYDDKNLYFLCVCEDPQADHLTRFSRDFVSIALQRESEKDRWYQFVLHPFNDIHYAYIWKFYQDDEKERSWTSSWETATTIQSHRWLAEGKIPLADIGITGTPPPIFYINIHRESGLLGTSTFTGRLDNWEQFGLLIFEPKP
ncbi:MAG TPA: HEAT repeat domain-containing protein, partial [bacterium]|nr:HEAT repeat domain-containing protein [bacterium]